MPRPEDPHSGKVFSRTGYTSPSIHNQKQTKIKTGSGGKENIGTLTVESRLLFP
jgi:hypothetical protein